MAAVFRDVDGPNIYEVDVQPVSPTAGDTVTVTIYCIDSSGISDAKLNYSINGGQWHQEEMHFYTCLCAAGGRWVANFGPLKGGDQVKFYATAYDASPNTNSASSQVFSLQVET